MLVLFSLSSNEYEIVPEVICWCGCEAMLRDGVVLKDRWCCVERWCRESVKVRWCDTFATV